MPTVLFPPAPLSWKSKNNYICKYIVDYVAEIKCFFREICLTKAEIRGDEEGYVAVNDLCSIYFVKGQILGHDLMPLTSKVL